jgi:hypothetical protein
LLRINLPNFSLQNNDKTSSVEFLEKIYALHPVPQDFSSVWRYILPDNLEDKFEFAVRHQIPIPSIMIIYYFSSAENYDFNFSMLSRLVHNDFYANMVKPYLHTLWKKALDFDFQKLKVFGESAEDVQLAQKTAVLNLVQNNIPFTPTEDVIYLINTLASEDVKKILENYTRQQVV